MANKVAVATGNWLTAGTWFEVDHNLISTNTGVTALTTGNLDSATFVPGNVAIQGVLIRLGVRASGSPTNTLTIHFRNSTTATNARTVVVNVSDLQVCDNTLRNGGWYFLKFSSALTPNGTDSYVIRATLSATSTAVSLCTNGTANNWQRVLVKTSTSVIGAGDDGFICGTYDGATSPATPASTTVTMDETASTDYGSASAGGEVFGLCVNNRATLSYGTSAATDYVLRLSGWMRVFAGGTFNMGTTGTPIPRGSTAVLEFDCASDAQFGLWIDGLATCNIRGLSRTSGKNVSWCLLSGDEAAAQTVLSVDTDTGWLSGDAVVIAGTNYGVGQNESKVLANNAGATTIEISAGLSSAHGGSTTTKVQAEVVLLTRNVMVRSVSTTSMAFVTVQTTAVVDFAWTDFRYLGANSNNFRGLTLLTTTGSASVTFCTIRDCDWSGVHFRGSTWDNITFTDNVCYNLSVTNTVNNHGWLLDTTTGTNWVASRNVVLDVDTASGFRGVSAGDLVGGTFTFNRIAGCTIGLNLGAITGGTWEDNVIHSTSQGGLLCSGDITDTTMSRFALWNNGSSSGGGVAAGGVILNRCRFVDWLMFKNGSSGSGNFVLGTTYGCIFENPMFYGGVSGEASPTGRGIEQSGGTVSINLQVRNGEMGVAGTYVAHAGSDILVQAGAYVEMYVSNTRLATSLEVSFNAAAIAHGRVHIQNRDATAGLHGTYTRVGNVERETTTVDVSPSIKMTPLSAGIKLESGTFQPGYGYAVPVDSGQQPTITVKVRKSAAYNGNAPRLILKANPAIGIDADEVLDTLSVAADTWETLSGAPSVPVEADGVLEVVVDCDGTAGAAFVDTVTASPISAIHSSGLAHWREGLPVVCMGGASLDAAAGGRFNRGFN